MKNEFRILLIIETHLLKLNREVETIRSLKFPKARTKTRHNNLSLFE